MTRAEILSKPIGGKNRDFGLDKFDGKNRQHTRKIFGFQIVQKHRQEVNSICPKNKSLQRRFCRIFDRYNCFKPDSSASQGICRAF
jgi:hypothetical protein